jgi:hypothetical protein
MIGQAFDPLINPPDEEGQTLEPGVPASLNTPREISTAYKREQMLKSSAPGQNPLTALHDIKVSKLEVSQLEAGTGMPFESPAAGAALAYEEVQEQQAVRNPGARPTHAPKH